MSLHRTVRRVIPSLGGVAARLGIPIPFRPAPDPVWTVLAAFAASRSGRAATFVQIGSKQRHDGGPVAHLHGGQRLVRAARRGRAIRVRSLAARARTRPAPSARERQLDGEDRQVARELMTHALLHEDRQTVGELLNDLERCHPRSAPCTGRSRARARRVAIPVLDRVRGRAAPPRGGGSPAEGRRRVRPSGLPR
jgi:hypothetical protein